ncbi:hypothetical protein Tco_0778346 [Tanacetum coccineum]
MLGRQIDDENDDDENVPLNYSINNYLSIQFGREEFCLLTGLRFEVENREEYDTQANLPFKRRMFPSHLDGQPITGIDIENAIEGPTFAELYNEDVVGLYSYVPQLSTPGAYDRRCAFKESIQGTKSGSCGHEMEQTMIVLIAFESISKWETWVRGVQQTLANVLFSEMVKDMEVHFDMTMRQKAVFECLRAPHAHDFLLAIPIDGLGQHMSLVKYRTILKYRLMIPLFPVDAISPVCRKACLDSFGEHAVHCKELS